MTELTHAERVAKAVPPEYQVVALLHDAIEDGHLTWPAAVMTLRPAAYEALALLTRDPGDTYAEYIEAIATASGSYGRIARTVKIADLQDNLARPTDKGDLRKRYVKALIRLQEVQA